MKKIENFLGVDVGKHILEYCLIGTDNQIVNKGKVNNNAVSLGKFFSQLENNGYSKSTSLVIFENTGIYSNPISRYLHENQWPYSEVPALEIKRSKGLSRGKSDRADARDIAVYGLRNMDKIILSTEPETLLQQLKILATEREKILAAIQSFSRTSEAEEFLGKEVFKVVKVVNRQTIAALKKQLKSVDDLLAKLVRSNEDLKHQQELLKSIPGIAEVSSVYLLLATKGFTKFKNWRKFACYVNPPKTPTV